MPRPALARSAAWSFSDPLDYERAIRAANIQILRVAKSELGAYRADLSRVDLGSVWMQRFTEKAPRLMRQAFSPSRSILMFRTNDGRGALRHSGYDVDDDTLLLIGAGAVDIQATTGPVGLGTASLSPENLARFGAVLAERDLRAPRETTAWRADPEAFSRLRSLNKAAARLARSDPEILDHPEVARAFEDAFIVAMVRCVCDGKPRAGRFGLRRSRTIVGKIEDYLSEFPDRPVHVAELCLALDVPERSLERACHEIVGMSPKKFLVLRRLNLTRRQLAAAEASVTTVAEVALAHGFWELGRFAVRYREIFGETPSATLRRPAHVFPSASRPLSN